MESMRAKYGLWILNFYDFLPNCPLGIFCPLAPQILPCGPPWPRLAVTDIQGGMAVLVYSVIQNIYQT